MPMLRYRVQTLMIVVAIVALDCALVPLVERLAGGLMLGIAMELGWIRLLHARGRTRRFWIGFEAAGAAVLAVYAVGWYTCSRMLGAWVVTVVTFGNQCASCLPDEVYLWLLRHVIIDPNAALRVIDLVVLLEVAIGFPMLLFVTLTGAGAASRWRPVAAAAPEIANATRATDAEAQPPETGFSKAAAAPPTSYSGMTPLWSS